MANRSSTADWRNWPFCRASSIIVVDCNSFFSLSLCFLTERWGQLGNMKRTGWWWWWNEENTVNALFNFLKFIYFFFIFEILKILPMAFFPILKKKIKIKIKFVNKISFGEFPFDILYIPTRACPTKKKINNNNKTFLAVFL